jgi:hypothetical protein
LRLVTLDDVLEKGLKDVEQMNTEGTAGRDLSERELNLDSVARPGQAQMLYALLAAIPGPV